MEGVTKINLPSKMLHKDNTCRTIVRRTQAKDLLRSPQHHPTNAGSDTAHQGSLSQEN